MHFTASLGIGLALGVVNWALWAGWTKRLLKKKKVPWGLFFAVSVLKLGVLAALIGWLFLRGEVDPVGFLAGFSVVVLLTLLKGYKWNS